MRDKHYSLFAAALAAAVVLLAAPLSFRAETAAPAAAQSPNIGVNGFFASDKAQRGRTLRAAVVLDIPAGYHVNSNRPLASYLIPTSLRVSAPAGVRVGPVSYPRALLRTFSFSPDKLSVYEGRAVLRFNVTIAQGFSGAVANLRASLRYQSCNDEACFAPTTRNVNMPIGVVGADDPVKSINGRIFGRK